MLHKILKTTLLLFYWYYNPLWVLASSFLSFRDHTHSGTTTQHKTQQTDIHALGGIRIRNPSKRSAVDTRLRPLGHWDGHYVGIM